MNRNRADTTALPVPPVKQAVASVKQTPVLKQAVQYSFPVLLGYLAIGIAFGLLAVEKGYPWHVALVMSVVMYAGAGQYIAVGLFAAAASLPEMLLVQFVVNARHMAYGLTMLKRFNNAGRFKYYLIFALTDETFALLSSLPETGAAASGVAAHTPDERNRFMFFVALLDHVYWIAGSVIGAIAGALLPFDFTGIDFALTALFIVLMIEQLLRVKKASLFVITAMVTVLATLFLPSRLSLLSALAFSLVAVQALRPTVSTEQGG
jgi:4-azaleucine resistance transporter AzlC